MEVNQYDEAGFRSFAFNEQVKWRHEGGSAHEGLKLYRWLFSGEVYVPEEDPSVFQLQKGRTLGHVIADVCATYKPKEVDLQGHPAYLRSDKVESGHVFVELTGFDKADPATEAVLTYLTGILGFEPKELDRADIKASREEGALWLR